MSATASKRYAQAIFELGHDTGKLEAVQKDLKAIDELVQTCPELREFLQSPVIPHQKRQEVIAQIFKKQLNALTHHLILLLNEKKRLNCLRGICQEFERMYLEHSGILTVGITSSVMLGNHQVGEITRHLKSKFDMDIKPLTTVDPGLIGGIKIRRGNTIYDYSFRAQLERIRKRIITA
jgi:F-type H+-transporting ATPase subunit delta